VTNLELVTPERVDAARVHGVAARKARGRDCCCMIARCEVCGPYLCEWRCRAVSCVGAWETQPAHARLLYLLMWKWTARLCRRTAVRGRGGSILAPVRRWFVVVAARCGCPV